jgi:hypothetical protein
MDFAKNYQPEDYSAKMIEPGDHPVKIIKIEEKTSQKGNNMLVVHLSVPGASFTMKHFLVEGEYFNGNMTKFFDCFGIRRGDFNFVQWVDKVGKAHLEKGEANAEGKSFLEIAYLIVEGPVAGAQGPAKPRIPQNTPQATPAPRQAPPAYFAPPTDYAKGEQEEIF